MRSEPRAKVGPRGRIPALAGAAVGAVGLRAASGYLLFLLAFALRRGEYPTYWFGALAGAGVLGGFLADVISPRLPDVHEERVVTLCVLGAGVGALVAFQAFALGVLIGFGVVAGAASEFGRLAFQSLMQRNAPEGAFGRVFVRYEVVFQLGWIGGALLPALLPIGFRNGILTLAGFYFALSVVNVLRRRLEAERLERS
jgi:hypothetical protein